MNSKQSHNRASTDGRETTDRTREISASSPAKIHLIGEYSALWGKPAIILPINLRLNVILDPAQPEIESKQPFQKIIEAEIEKRFKKKIPNYKLAIKSEIPIGSGLGSSAALSYALTKALLKLLKVKSTNQDVFDIA